MVVAGEGLLITFIFITMRSSIANLFFYEKEGILIFMSYLCIVGVSELFMNVEIMTAGALAAIGKTRISSIICVTFTAIRLPIAYGLIAAGVGVNSIWWAFSISRFLKGCIMFGTFQVDSTKLGWVIFSGILMIIKENYSILLCK